MESFDNYNDTASQYGPPPLDDTASMFSGYTSKNGDNTPLNLDSLSLSDQTPLPASDVKSEEDFDGVLDDLKDEDAEAFPHACRQVFAFASTHPQLTGTTPFQLLWHSFTGFSGKMPGLL